jgi:pimeloyl-ACP methyl ester carboxylesterase
MQYLSVKEAFRNWNSAKAFLGLAGRKSATLGFLCLPLLAVNAFAQATPAPDPNGPANIFYGSVLPTAASGPILVFVHGLNGTAADWWYNQVAGTPNLMYNMAYSAGYRTAFISLNADNSRNNDSWQTNGTTLKGYLQTVSAHFNGAKMYLVGHSEGGLDIQAALLNAQYTALDPTIAPMVKAVFTIATPNQGTPLADWAFGAGSALAGALGLNTQAVQSLEVAVVTPFRAQADPIFAQSGIQFYTYAGNSFKGQSGNVNLVLLVSGLILDTLTTGEANDGLVPVNSTNLPFSYAMQLGQNGFNHYNMLEGAISFPVINGPAVGLERQPKQLTVAGSIWSKIATGGFSSGSGQAFVQGPPGSDSNSFAWSSAWFKGQLFVGTGREVKCVSAEAGVIQTGVNDYPPPDGTCTKDPKDLKLQAEIWSYTPQTHIWTRVYQSPADIAIGNDSAGNAVFAAEDIGYRGMTVFTESDGTQALYIGGVSAGEIYGQIPPYTFQSYPPPRILRTTDGVNFAPLPQPAGSFLANISSTAPTTANVFGFRSLTSYNGMLFATAGNYTGSGYVIASANPAAGGDAWFSAGPPFAQLPVWEMTTFNNELFVAGGNPQSNDGYFVAETNAVGSPPYTFNTIVQYANAQGQPGDALSMAVFNGGLYVGTDAPTEMIRVNADNSYSLIVGDPRQTPEGLLSPLTGFGEFFSDQFSRHFWRLGVVPSGAHAGLYMTTYDWSVQLKGLWEFSNLIIGDFGTDVYSSPDGLTWKSISVSGFGDGFNYGLRTIQPSPFGTFFGTARFEGGLQIWMDQTQLDYDGNGEIDQTDVSLLTARVGQPANGPNDPMDLDQDGQITVLDARLLATQCTNSGCAVSANLPVIVPPPANLIVTNPTVTEAQGASVQLSWNPVPGAQQYHVYRQTDTPMLQIFPASGIALNLGLLSINIPQDILDNKYTWLTGPSGLCPPNFGSDDPLCAAIYVVEEAAVPGNTIGFPIAAEEIAVTNLTTFSESAPTSLQSIYWVKAEDALGNRSDPSNIVGAPAPAAPTTTGTAATGVF